MFLFRDSSMVEQVAVINLQPSGEIQNEKWGELREALKGNPEPSLANGLKVAKKVQRLRVRSQSNKLYSAPHPNG